MSKDLHSKDLQKLIQRKKLHLNRIPWTLRRSPIHPPSAQPASSILRPDLEQASQQRISEDLNESAAYVRSLETRPNTLIPVGPGVAASSVSGPLPEIRLFILGLSAATS